MALGCHQAASRRIDLVAVETSVLAPPITPAMPMASSSLLAMTPSELSSVRSRASRVTMVSPAAARLTLKWCPGTRSASNAWLG